MFLVQKRSPEKSFIVMFGVLFFSIYAFVAGTFNIYVWSLRFLCLTYAAGPGIGAYACLSLTFRNL